MKKFFYVLMAAATLAAVSCDKEGNKDGENGGADEVKLPQPTHRIKEIHQDGGAEVFAYTYNEDGTVATLKASYEGSVWGDYVFTYEGNKLTVTNKAADDAVEMIAFLNDQKLAEEIKYYIDGKNFELECTYDKNGFLLSCSKDGALQTVQQITEDGCVEFWTRIGIAETIGESADAAGWRKKMHTYYGEANIAGIHTEWNEDTGVKRWIYETGLLGRASTLVCKTAWWYGVADKEAGVVNQEYAEKLAYYPLTLGEDGCVSVEYKYYDKATIYEEDPTKMSGEKGLEFICEPIAK